jgi:hypothetical protein
MSVDKHPLPPILIRVQQDLTGSASGRNYPTRGTSESSPNFSSMSSIPRPKMTNETIGYSLCM